MANSFIISSYYNNLLRFNITS